MVLIGLAYNQKPEPTELASPASEGGRQEDGELPRPDEEPSSRIADLSVAELIARDEFAEWDSPTTIAAVESALSKLGKVVRLEANEDFPERLRHTKPNIVFNIAEGFYGVNREAHVPAICEFFGIPYSGSDPFTLSLCLDKARAKETLAFHGIPTPKFVVVNKPEELRAASEKLRFPLFVKPLHEGSSKGITDSNLCRDAGHLLDFSEHPVELLLRSHQRMHVLDRHDLGVLRRRRPRHRNQRLSGGIGDQMQMKIAGRRRHRRAG